MHENDSSKWAITFLTFILPHLEKYQVTKWVSMQKETIIIIQSFFSFNCYTIIKISKLSYIRYTSFHLGPEWSRWSLTENSFIIIYFYYSQLAYLRNERSEKNNGRNIKWGELFDPIKECHNVCHYRNKCFIGRKVII